MYNIALLLETFQRGSDMKNIKNYRATKYVLPLYAEVSSDIFKCDHGFVTSLSFEQEPEYEEGASAAEISQYPLEDILDRFCVYISDFYKELNAEDSTVCYLEFCASSAERIQQLREIIGKHVYNKETGGIIDLVVE